MFDLFARASHDKATGRAPTERVPYDVTLLTRFAAPEVGGLPGGKPLCTHNRGHGERTAND
jgi:hypothetical protein